MLFLLLLADVLAEVNRFSKYFQHRGLIFANINAKLQQLVTNLQRIQEHDGAFFKEYAQQFLRVSLERMELARRTRGHVLLDIEDDLADKIASFKTRVKYPFMDELFLELNSLWLKRES